MNCERFRMQNQNAEFCPGLSLGDGGWAILNSFYAHRSALCVSFLPVEFCCDAKNLDEHADHPECGADEQEPRERTQPTIKRIAAARKNEQRRCNLPSQSKQAGPTCQTPGQTIPFRGLRGAHCIGINVCVASADSGFFAGFPFPPEIRAGLPTSNRPLRAAPSSTLR